MADRRDLSPQGCVCAEINTRHCPIHGNGGPFDAVHLVTFSDWDAHHVESAWTTEDAAVAEMKRLTEASRSLSGKYDVETFPLDQVPS